MHGLISHESDTLDQMWSATEQKPSLQRSICLSVCLSPTFFHFLMSFLLMIVVQWHIKCSACTSEFGAGRKGVSAISASGSVSVCMSRANQCPVTAESWESVDWKSALVEPRGLSKRPRALNANVWHWFALQTHSTHFVIVCFVVKCLGFILHDWELGSTMRIFFVCYEKVHFYLPCQHFQQPHHMMVLFFVN